MAFDLYGAGNASRYNLMAEAGINIAAGRGLTLTPKASLGYSSYSFGGFREAGGEAALQIDNLQIQRLESRIGGAIAGTMRVGGWKHRSPAAGDLSTPVRANDGDDGPLRQRRDHSFVLPPPAATGCGAKCAAASSWPTGRSSFGLGSRGLAVGPFRLRDDGRSQDFTFRF